jgi:glycine betaine/proline transport system substrate-binding protein
MLKKRYLVATAMAVGLFTGQNAVAADECGDITIASMTWASAELIAEIDKMILTEGYGCKAELVVGDTMPTFTAMIEKGSPDLAPEFWINAVREPLDSAVAKGELIMAAEILSDGGEEGWWIPKYVADVNPEIKTPADALARPDLFPAPEDDSLGAVHNCPSGWNCQISTANLFAAYGGVDKDQLLKPTYGAKGGWAITGHRLRFLDVMKWLSWIWGHMTRNIGLLAPQSRTVSLLRLMVGLRVKFSV